MAGIRTLLLATGMALACSGAAQAGTSFNGVALNGASLNGLSANGVSLNGTNLNGLSANGVSLNGANLNGISANGVVLNGLPAAPADQDPAARTISLRRLGRLALEAPAARR